MKKSLLLAGMLFMLFTFSAFAAHDLYEFTSDMEKAIYKGTRDGKLTQREVNRLQDYIDEYQFAIWKFENRGRISKNEKRTLGKMQDEILETLDYALSNREVVRNRWNRGNRYGVSGRGGTRYQGQNDRYGNRDLCPPPRNNRPRRRGGL